MLEIVDLAGVWMKDCEVWIDALSSTVRIDFDLGFVAEGNLILPKTCDDLNLGF